MAINQHDAGLQDHAAPKVIMIIVVAIITCGFAPLQQWRVAALSFCHAGSALLVDHRLNLSQCDLKLEDERSGTETGQA